MKRLLALSLSAVVFIMLINVKMPTIVGILTFMSRINFMLGWVEHRKSFITSGPTHEILVIITHVQKPPLFFHAGISRGGGGGARGHNFGLSLQQHPYFVSASSDESVHMCRLAWAFNDNGITTKISCAGSYVFGKIWTRKCPFLPTTMIQYNSMVSSAMENDK